MGRFFTVAAAIENFFWYVKQALFISIRGIFNFIFWGPAFLGKLRVAWFSGFLGVAIGMNQWNEFGAAAALLVLSAVAAIAQIWRWTPEKGENAELLGAKVILTCFALGCLTYFLLLDNNSRKGGPWTQLPESIETFKAELHPESTQVVWINWTPHFEWAILSPPKAASTKPKNSNPLNLSDSPEVSLIKKGIDAESICYGLEREFRENLQNDATLYASEHPNATPEQKSSHWNWKFGILKKNQVQEYRQIYQTKFTSVRQDLAFAGAHVTESDGYTADFNDSDGNLSVICSDLEELTESYIGKAFMDRKITQQQARHLAKN